MASSPARLPASDPSSEEALRPSPLPPAEEGSTARRLRLPPLRPRKRRLLPLPLKLRVSLFFIGWTLVLIGVVGLVLPVVQGLVFLFVGAALLSLVSELIYELLHFLFSRWPRLWRRVEGFRLVTHRRLRRRFHHRRPPPR